MRVEFRPVATRLTLFGFGGSFEALQFFSGLEADGFAWRDVDLFAGARVAADAGFARLHAEKVADAGQSLLPRARGGLDLPTKTASARMVTT